MEETHIKGLIKGLPKLEYLKNWRNAHKESGISYSREWYAINKDAFLQKLLAPVTCECGFTCGKTNLKRHQKTKLHLKKLSLKV